MVSSSRIRPSTPTSKEEPSIVGTSDGSVVVEQASPNGTSLKTSSFDDFIPLSVALRTLNSRELSDYIAEKGVFENLDNYTPFRTDNSDPRMRKAVRALKTYRSNNGYNNIQELIRKTLDCENERIHVEIRDGILYAFSDEISGLCIFELLYERLFSRNNNVVEWTTGLLENLVKQDRHKGPLLALIEKALESECPYPTIEFFVRKLLKPILEEGSRIERCIESIFSILNSDLSKTQFYVTLRDLVLDKHMSEEAFSQVFDWIDRLILSEDYNWNDTLFKIYDTAFLYRSDCLPILDRLANLAQDPLYCIWVYNILKAYMIDRRYSSEWKLQIEDARKGIDIFETLGEVAEAEDIRDSAQEYANALRKKFQIPLVTASQDDLLKNQEEHLEGSFLQNVLQGS